MLLTAFDQGRIWDPFEAIGRVREQMEDLLENTGRKSEGFPLLNLWTGEQGAIVMAELPGLNPDNLDVSVQGRVLTLKGTRPEEALQEGDLSLRRESTAGDFERSLELPFDIQEEGVEARYAKGVLTLKLPRSQGDSAHKIQVKSS